MLELLGGTKDRRLECDQQSSQPVFDRMALKEIETELLELQEERERAEENNDLAEMDRLDEAVSRLVEQLQPAVGLGGKSRDMNNPADKHRPTIHANLKRAYKGLREASPPMGQLADHFESSISASGATFIYDPKPAPAWNLTLPILATSSVQ